MDNESAVGSEKPGLVKKLFKAVGRAGSSVGGMAGGLLRTAGQTAKDAGSRASLTFSKEVDETPLYSLRELAESLTQWLVQEHEGRTDLQQQKPSTIELSEMAQAGHYEVTLDEPGLLGRTFRFVLRHSPLADTAANFPERSSEFHAQALIVLEWPKTLEQEPKGYPVMVWGQAALVGQRNPALDIASGWAKGVLGGTFPLKQVLTKGRPQRAVHTPLWGREQELGWARDFLLTPRYRTEPGQAILSLAAPGGTGKSYFLKALRTEVGYRVRWAGVDHHGIDKEASPSEVLAKLLSSLAKQLSEQSVPMEEFRKELHLFRKQKEKLGGTEPTGIFSHMKKAVESAAGANPVLNAATAGMTFLASWRQQVQEESEALLRDDQIKSLTEAFKSDLSAYSRRARSATLCWSRPVLVFDTYEWLAGLIDSWLRTELLSGDFLESGDCSILLSGRESLLATDTRWSEWQHQTLTIELQPFDKPTAEAYLESLKVPSERFEELHELTVGLPLFLSLAAHILDQDQAVSVLTYRVLEEVPKEVHQEFLRASLLDGFERGGLEKLFPDKAPEELDTLSAWLQQATFTVAKDGRRAFLPSVRRVLCRALELELGRSQVEELRARL